MNNDLREATLTHYDRMIAMVKLTPAVKLRTITGRVVIVMRHLYNETPGGYDCPLCKEYIAFCPSCPVYKVTNCVSCEESPWHNIMNSRNKTELLKALRAEREFLEGLDYE